MTEVEQKEPRWLTVTFLRAVHADQVRRHGGSLGFRDNDLLHSALARARNRWHYEQGPELVELAAVYGFGLVRNHAFVDGNKRVAFQAMYVFLGLNGWRITADEADVVTLMMEAASGAIDEADLADWLREHTEPR